MGHIGGITITLYDQVLIGADDMNAPVYEEKPVQVGNVLYAPVEAQEVLDTTDLKGRKLVIQLAIPKGDSHKWEDRDIEIDGKRFHTIGPVSEGIDKLIPLDWNKKIKAESYE